jgi:hypothetical protein
LSRDLTISFEPGGGVGISGAARVARETRAVGALRDWRRRAVRLRPLSLETMVMIVRKIITKSILRLLASI